METTLIGGKFKLGRKISTGPFADLYSGTDIQSGQEVTIKLERSENTKASRLHMESKAYTRGVPQLKWFGVHGEYNALVTDPLGPSLEDLFNRCNGKFTLKTVLMLVTYLINKVQVMHSKGYVHRDISPANFFMGKKEWYIANYDRAKQYIDPHTHEHIPFRENTKQVGSVCYSSHNSHLGVEQSRRDDLESLGYMLVYFIRGRLPWQGYKSPIGRHMYEKIKDKKLSTSIQVLCQSLPPEFEAYFWYCRSLRFSDKPDYSYLRMMFQNALLREGYQFDLLYDWITLTDPGIGSSKSSGEVGGSNTGPSAERTEKRQA
ncbi:hypothetical protein MKW98_027836 [Papaver atlanticum]|uniref:Protein kinase domain-containing protein n=1 Tax=Papaver atlanticum TaxID=357466 RepID=A0AAD4XGJ1_9MAGN|nr:hypothetical protein MKW98_027836 [Papaver atlanticum]